MAEAPVVGIIAKHNSAPAHSLAARLIDNLDDGVSVMVDEATADALGRQGSPVSALTEADLVVSIGGDGTFLFAVREVGGTPIVGVNLGEVGFLNAVSPDEAPEIVSSLVERLRQNGSLEGRTRRRIVARGDGWELVPALNEVLVQGRRRGPAGGAEFEIRVDGRRYERTAADGVLVATPTGSTAYNLSEDGSLLSPELAGLTITPMCSREGVAPLIVDENSSLSVTVTGCEEAVAIADGRTIEPLSPPATVDVELTDEPVTVVGPPVDFFQALEKLR